jgi:hypothetical protein
MCTIRRSDGISSRSQLIHPLFSKVVVFVPATVKTHFRIFAIFTRHQRAGWETQGASVKNLELVALLCDVRSAVGVARSFDNSFEV